MRARKPESFWEGGGGGECERECHGGGNKLSNFSSLIVLWPGKGKTFSYKNNLTNLSGET